MSAGRYVRAPSVDSVNHYEELEDEYLDDIDSGTVGATEEVEFQEFDDAMNKDDLPMKGKAREPEIGWHYTEAQPTSMQVGNCSYAGGRLDNPPQFPKNVPTSRLQEEWNRFLQKFEIAASLSKISDPAQLAKHLFMCMGDQLQDIVCIAKLRPGLNDPRCYRTMVDNINAHLRKLTDPITEHEMFSRMSQGQDETLDGFLVRLKSKVRLCEYSDQDEDRFVYTQLLKGMHDKKAGRRCENLRVRHKRNNQSCGAKRSVHVEHHAEHQLGDWHRSSGCFSETGSRNPVVPKAHWKPSFAAASRENATLRRKS